MLLPAFLSLFRHNAYFVDLFVRASNATAIGMYNAVSKMPPFIIYKDTSR
jgi:hypothetical protein